MLDRIANFDPDELAGYLDELTGLFENIDTAYQQVAGHYGFECTGCRDNCCLTLFYHHTVLETMLLKKGFLTLDRVEQDDIRQRALRVSKSHRRAEVSGRPIKAMCPLNHAGLCRLYHQRPMICRMHGIPNELKLPGQAPSPGPGCGEFDKEHGPDVRVRLDRTPFYSQLAHLEGRLRREYGLQGKIKMTVAQIITTF